MAGHKGKHLPPPIQPVSRTASPARPSASPTQSPPTSAPWKAAALTTAWPSTAQARPAPMKLRIPPVAPIQPSAVQRRGSSPIGAAPGAQPPPTKYGPIGITQAKRAPNPSPPPHHAPPSGPGQVHRPQGIIQRAAAPNPKAILVPQGTYYRGAKVNLFTEGIATCVGLYADIGNGGCFFAHIDQPVGANEQDTIAKINAIIDDIQDIVGNGRIKYISAPSRTPLSQAIEAAFAGRIDAKFQMDQMFILGNGNISNNKCNLDLIPGGISILTHTPDAERNFYRYGADYAQNPKAAYSGPPKAVPARFAVKK